MKRLSTGVLLVALLAYAPYVRAKQLITGRYYPEKKQHLVGEPIIIVFEIVNNSQKADEIGESDCPSTRADPFEVDGATRKKKPVPFSCGRAAVVLDCLVGTTEIPAKRKYIKRLILNGPFLLNSPGTYHVRATSEENIWRRDMKEILAHLHVESEFDLTLRVPREGELEAAYQPFFNDLNNGPDFEIRYFAATAIAQHPPLFVEPVLTRIVDSPGTTIPNIVDASIVGLGRLATPSARAKLIAMASTGPDEFRQSAIQALGELGNPSDCPALLFIGSQNKYYTQEEAYLYAGRICKERAIPALLRLLNANAWLSGYIALALENTLSRDAISPLIGLLASPDQYVRHDAEGALETLTHRKSRSGIASVGSSRKSRIEWTIWWAVSGRNATIYGPDQCVDPQPLPW